jgi:hypothetical protein
MLVATSFDFSVLRGMRPVAAGNWEDVVRVHAFRKDEDSRNALHLRLTMRDGKQFIAHEDAPGWEDFLAAAEDALAGFPALAEWVAQLDVNATHGGDVVIYTNTL